MYEASDARRPVIIGTRSMKILRLIMLSATAALALSACGDGATNISSPGGQAADGGGGNAGSGATAGSGTTAGSGGNATSGEGGRTTGPRAEALPPPECPQSEPSDGGACDAAGLKCSYGEGARVDCRRNFECNGSTWVAKELFAGSDSCREPPEEQCTEEMPANGDPCEIGSPWPCEHGSTLCYCPSVFECGPDGIVTCPAGANHWNCVPPPADLDCPELPPNVGDGCATQGKECLYGDKCSRTTGRLMFCRNGAWEFAGTIECGG